MSGVGRNEEHGLAVLGHLYRERARGRRLADAAFAADEDPSEGGLVDEVLEGRGEGVVVAVDDGGGHGGGGERGGYGKGRSGGWCDDER